ncbi:helix-turn-helix domain-containing protein [Mesorhizobium newzealandense]|uniref:Helix-turn-helix domain-containing protein n=1 Tax=Mesorhizobium newzealandense TaxID=1300302 RepID=A0ABW4UG84_9HYPH
MTRSLSADLRGRVIAAIEDGVSTREAARRFRTGISTAGSWYRRYRETGEMEARKQGQPSRSKLDARGHHSWPHRARAGHHACRDRGAPCRRARRSGRQTHMNGTSPPLKPSNRLGR